MRASASRRALSIEHHRALSVKRRASSSEAATNNAAASAGRARAGELPCRPPLCHDDCNGGRQRTSTVTATTNLAASHHPGAVSKHGTIPTSAQECSIGGEDRTPRRATAMRRYFHLGFALTVALSRPTPAWATSAPTNYPTLVHHMGACMYRAYMCNPCMSD